MALAGLLGAAAAVVMRRAVGCGLCDRTRGHLSGVGSTTGDEAFVIGVVVVRAVGDALVLPLHALIHVLMAAMPSRVGYGLQLGPVVDSGNLDG